MKETMLAFLPVQRIAQGSGIFLVCAEQGRYDSPEHLEGIQSLVRFGMLDKDGVSVQGVVPHDGAQLGGQTFGKLRTYVGEKVGKVKHYQRGQF